MELTPVRNGLSNNITNWRALCKRSGTVMHFHREPFLYFFQTAGLFHILCQDIDYPNIMDLIRFVRLLQVRQTG